MPYSFKTKKQAPQGHVFFWQGNMGVFLAPKKAEIQKILGSPARVEVD